MAETVVNFVLGKLGEMIVKEAQFLGEVGDKVEWVKTELTRIKCYLKDADSKRRKGDARAENYLNELRDVAYRIEDAIDTFYVELEIEENRHKLDGNSQKDRSFLGKLKRLGRKTTKLTARHNLGMELDGIKKVLEGISKSKIDYEIDPLQERGKGETVLMPSRRTTYQDMDEAEIVGFDTDKNNVRTLLLDPEIRRRAVVTIVGPGGLGKTTLAQMVYKSVQDDFNLHIMLSVSQQYSPIDLLKKMLTKLKNSEPAMQDIDDLISDLKGLLSSKRYLIILDDVWVADLWNQYLKHALPDLGNGSRVLMTSRFIEVAQSADPIMEPYELKILNDKDSRDLLIKKAFPYQKTGEKCPEDLVELADALSKKCKGLPLALIVLGGILLTKDRTYTAWERELKTMDWQSKGKDCIDILAMSFEDMPCYLKICFLFLASFPEDYEISARCLIKMWVADGFVPQQGRKIMEEIAEDCLEQLFQRSMIQVSSRHANGSIKYCRVHDLLRDFAMHQAGKENFITIFANRQDINHRDSTTRRASLQSCSVKLMEYVGPKTRSLFLFDLKGNLLMNYSEFRLLRVLVIEVVWSEELVKFRGIDRLIHLKYLGISNCSILDMSECSLGRLKNLETLDIRRNNMVSNLSTDLWTINTLKYVLCHELLPEIPSTADLRNLQTLEWILFDNKIIPHLNNLQRLGLESKSTQWDVEHALPHLLGGLSSLTSLKIKSIESNLPMEIIYPKALPYYQNLQILYLDGQWPESVTLKASLFPLHLVKLTLCYSYLGQDPMSELAKLNNLKELVLKTDVYNGRQMVCSEGFPVLQKLVISILTVMILTVAKGVMPKLKYLRIYDHCKVEAPPELLHSITLF
ncbi:hypothetical protein LUZ61_013491 [Rhynchospora tenuis]|uniref:AAA+ ATPase domain-containing protein n=1 Tax=Rhynchospora tenuis TaxID=198213 RepID=A0AAD5W8W5_9POAL|nr:hypothetical protein LUZ61_013491 [Rhynchospora tenuis]